VLLKNNHRITNIYITTSQIFLITFTIIIDYFVILIIFTIYYTITNIWLVIYWQYDDRYLKTTIVLPVYNSKIFVITFTIVISCYAIVILFTIYYYFKLIPEPL
jgi:hypothetical protein